MTAQQPAIIMTKRGIAIHMDGEQHSITESHRNYSRIKEAIRNQEWDKLPKLINVAAEVQSFAKGTVSVKDGEVFYKDMPLHNSLTRRLLRMMDEGFDIEPMRAFLENLMENPSHRAVSELYDFLENCELPITPDGHFLAYKNVRSDFSDIYSGKFDNSVGKVCEMPRNMVDEDKDRTCSKGLHFCSIGYLSSYGVGPGNVTVIVKINPRDVVAIPADHENQKGRTCLYEVVGVHKDRHEREAFDRTVHDMGGRNMSTGVTGTKPKTDMAQVLPHLKETDQLRKELQPSELFYVTHNHGRNIMPWSGNIRENERQKFEEVCLAIPNTTSFVRDFLKNSIADVQILSRDDNVFNIKLGNLVTTITASWGDDIEEAPPVSPAPTSFASPLGQSYNGQPRDPETGRFLKKAGKLFGFGNY